MRQTSRKPLMLRKEAFFTETPHFAIYFSEKERQNDFLAKMLDLSIGLEIENILGILRK